MPEKSSYAVSLFLILISLLLMEFLPVFSNRAAHPHGSSVFPESWLLVENCQWLLVENCQPPPHGSSVFRPCAKI